MDTKDQKITTIGQGQTIFRQGEKSTDLYFIRSGKIELSVRDKDGNEAIIATLGEKSVLGTMAFLEGEPRSATAKAITEVQSIVITGAQRDKLLGQIPNWFKILVKDLSSNLRRTNEEYTKFKHNFEEMEKKYNALKKKTDAAASAPAKK